MAAGLNVDDVSQNDVVFEMALNQFVPDMGTLDNIFDRTESHNNLTDFVLQKHPIGNKLLLEIEINSNIIK
jgi:hypothetical protein